MYRIVGENNTVHSYQGGEAGRVMIIYAKMNGKYGKCEDTNYMLSALTRATKSVLLFVVDYPTEVNDVN